MLELLYQRLSQKCNLKLIVLKVVEEQFEQLEEGFVRVVSVEQF